MSDRLHMISGRQWVVKLELGERLRLEIKIWEALSIGDGEATRLEEITYGESRWRREIAQP